MNPRLSRDWLRYLVSVGARHDDDGWRWKIDPSLRLGGFGPWRPEWAMSRLPGLGSPLLAVLAMQPEMMGWATTPDEVEPYLPPCSDLVVLDDVGHFVHIEQPERVARLVLDFPGGPAVTATVTLHHNRISLALHPLREGAGRPLLALHGLGERSPAGSPTTWRPGPAPVWALDFTGHGDSSIPAGGGYYAEVLMADADAALAHLGPSTVYGRGLGAYVALLVAGAGPSWCGAPCSTTGRA